MAMSEYRMHLVHGGYTCMGSRPDMLTSGGAQLSSVRSGAGNEASLLCRIDQISRSASGSRTAGSGGYCILLSAPSCAPSSAHLRDKPLFPAIAGALPFSVGQGKGSPVGGL